jgi:CheY-like chemotaxis protein
MNTPDIAGNVLADPSAAQAQPAAELSPEDLQRSLILIVDDNAQNCELLQAYLDTLGCQIITAADGIEAMKLIEQRTPPPEVSLSPPPPEVPNGAQAGQAGAGLPDLILLDVMMPRMSGFEVCRKLKDDPATRAIPIMMVTALNELGDIERGVESGTDDFVTKPVNKLELLTRVKSLLRVRHLKRELDRTMAYIQDIESRPPRQA